MAQWGSRCALPCDRGLDEVKEERALRFEDPWDCGYRCCFRGGKQKFWSPCFLSGIRPPSGGFSLGAQWVESEEAGGGKSE